MTHQEFAAEPSEAVRMMIEIHLIYMRDGRDPTRPATK